MPFYAKRTYRLLSGVFGAFLTAVGLFVLLFTGPLTALSVVAGIALVFLGGNMAIAAYCGKESWLSRLGPRSLVVWSGWLHFESGARPRSANRRRRGGWIGLKAGFAVLMEAVCG